MLVMRLLANRVRTDDDAIVSLSTGSVVLDVTGGERLVVLGADVDEELAVVAEVRALENAFPARIELKYELALVTA
jgi:hypothetical protein